MAIVLVLLTAIHLICMNIAAAGPLVTVGFDYATARREPENLRPAVWLAWVSFWLAIVGAIVGVVMGLLKWDVEYADVLWCFESRLLWGLVEFVFSLGLIAVYAWWLGSKPHVSGFARGFRSAIAVLSATNLLYHFPPLFTLIASASAGRIEQQRVTSSMFRELIGQGEVPAMTTHFVLASFAMSGGALIYRAWRDPSPAATTWAAVWGARIALVATALQIPVGMWLALSVPAISQRRIMGGDLIGSSLFLLSMLGSLLLLHQLAAVALRDTSQVALRRVLINLVLIVVMMVGVLQRVNG